MVHRELSIELIGPCFLVKRHLSFAMALLEVNNLQVWFPVLRRFFVQVDDVKAVDGVSFVVEEVAVRLVGESGAGRRRGSGATQTHGRQMAR